MRLTVSQLRQIIKEEAAHALSGSSVNPSEIEAMDEVGVLGVVAGIGEKLQGLSKRRGQVRGFAAMGNLEGEGAELAAVAAKLDEECRALQVCVAALKRKSADKRAQRNIAAAKAGKPGAV